MALLIFVRRLHRAAHPIVFLPHILSSPPNRTLPSASVSHSLPHHFVEAFHQILINPFCTSPVGLHFSTLQSSHNQKLNEIINFNEYTEETHENNQLGVSELVESVQKAKNFDSGDEALDFLEKCGVKPSKELIFSAIWALRGEWKLAFLVFKWGEKWDCIVEKTWCLMTWILGNHKKFGTAWSLIHNLHQGSMNAQQAILIMIDRYAATNHFGKAIQTFQIMEKFSLSPDKRAFFTFLNILCKHGNIEEGEEFMFLNKKLFPLEIEGFNIILNGWCNIAVDIFEAKRVWREMSKCCILPNGTSYTHMISCFSKVGNLFDSLRLYDEMKKRGFLPGIEVYNSLTYILARENCLKEALTIVNKMREAGLHPDSMSYNSMIHPLCEAKRTVDARKLLAMMIEDNVSPTVETYHAFLHCESLQGAFDLLNLMRKAGLAPRRDTFLLILSKFFELVQPESALKIWLEMKQYEIVPDSALYTALVEGLAKCGLLAKAREFYAEMRSKGIVNDPKLEKLIKEPVRETSGQGGEIRMVKQMKKSKCLYHGTRSAITGKRLHRNLTKKKTTGT